MNGRDPGWTGFLLAGDTQDKVPQGVSAVSDMDTVTGSARLDPENCRLQQKLLKAKGAVEMMLAAMDRLSVSAQIHTLKS